MNEESYNFFNGTESTSTSSSAASITAFKDLKGLENGLAVPRTGLNQTNFPSK